MKKFLLSILLFLSLQLIGQQTTRVKIPPGKDTTVVSFTTSTVATATTSVSYSLSAIPVKQDSSIAVSGAMQGFGSLAIGGSNSSDIRYVKTSADLTKNIGSNRTIVFDNDLLITGAAARVELYNTSYLTVDAAGHDITLDNGNNGTGISFGSGTHHCIVIGIRVINSGQDCINVVDGAHDIYISNCSVYDYRDGGIDIAASKTLETRNISIVNCIIGRGNISAGGDFGGAMLITGKNVSVYRNLFVPATPKQPGERCPAVHCNYSNVGSPNADVRNNAVINWGRNDGTGSGFGIASMYGATINAVNNYLYTKNSSASPGNAILIKSQYGSNPAGMGYASGNISGNSGINPNAEKNANEYLIPLEFSLQTTSVCDAVKFIRSNVGPAKRNDIEDGYINSITNLVCQ